jgi:sugar (pentulose or hexulose) kinase
VRHVDRRTISSLKAVERATALVGPPSRLVVFGGGSRTRPWCRRKAEGGARDGIAVWRSRAGEAAARGAALQAGVAAGWWSSTAEAPSPGLDEVLDYPPEAFFRL